MKPVLTTFDVIALIVGIVIGVGIFETPSLIAANVSNATMLMAAWLIGGVVSLVGCLCFAELGAAYPHAGGNYYYLGRTFGPGVAFLFAWSRMTILQTGSLVLLAFVFGDYVSRLLPLAGELSSSLYAALVVLGLTGLNVLGLHQGRWTQNVLTAAKVLGLGLVIAIGLIGSPVAASAGSVSAGSGGSFGLAMVFVLLSYGGWNEAAFVTAEMEQVQRNLLRSLLWGMAIITGIYLLINFAYLHGLGLAGMSGSKAVAADLMQGVFGEVGARLISVLVAISTLGAVNATVLTGARTNYAMGRDFRIFRFLGRLDVRAATPATALWVQGAIGLLLVLLGSLTRKGFSTMVDYTSPIFWLFMLLTGVSLLVLRMQDPDQSRPFQVPFYPLTPILFCLMCGYMLYSSLAYTGVGALTGIAVLLAGIPFLFWIRPSTPKHS